MAKPDTTIDEHGQERDRRGEWRSGRPAYLEPLLDFPTSPKRIFKWFFGIPGFFFPWFAVYMVIITVTYFFLTPELSKMQTLSIDWIAEIAIRNIALLTIWTGGFHLLLYGWRKQGR